MPDLSQNQFRVAERQKDRPWDLTPGFGPVKPGKAQQGTLLRGGPGGVQHKRPIPGAMPPEDADEWFAGTETVHGRHATDAGLENFVNQGFRREDFGSAGGVGWGSGVYMTPTDLRFDQDAAENHQTMYADYMAHDYGVMAESPRDVEVWSEPERVNPAKAHPIGVGWDDPEAASLTRREVFEAAGVPEPQGHRFETDIAHELQRAGHTSLTIVDSPWEAEHLEDGMDYEEGADWRFRSPGTHGTQRAVFDPNAVKVVDDDAPPVDRQVMRRRRRKLRKRDA